MTYKDKNGTQLKIGDKLKDSKNKIWKLANVCGISMLIYPVTGEIEKSIILRKVDFKKFEKVQ